MRCWMFLILCLLPTLPLPASSSFLRAFINDDDPADMYDILGDSQGNALNCSPAPSNGTLLCDPDLLLTDDYVDKIQSQLRFLRHNSTFRCAEDKGVDMGVYIHQYRRPRNRAAVNALREYLELGSCGVLLYMVITPADQAFVYLSWGSDLDRFLSGLVVQSMKDGMLPFLRHRLYGEAIHAAILDLTAFFEGDPSSLEGYLLTEHLKHLGFASWLLLFCCSCFGYLPLCLLDLFLGYRAWRRQQQAEEERQEAIVREVEEKLQEIEEHYSNRGRYNTNNQQKSGLLRYYHEGDFMSKVCPICLDEFPPVPTDDDYQIEAPPPTEETPLFRKGRLGSDGQPIKSLPCGHVFDRSCVVSWMIAIRTKNRNARLTCPVCMEAF